MPFGTAGLQPLRAATAAALLASAALLPAAALGAATDPDLVATIELEEGDIAYELEPGTLHFFDEGGQPLAVQVIDGCDINDHLWVFGAGLSGVSTRLTIRDRQSGVSTVVVLPPFEPGEPVGTVLEPEALPLCQDDIASGGLPPLDALATFTSADRRAEDGIAIITLVSDGRDNAYRRLLRTGVSFDVLGRGSPIVALDDEDDMDQLYLFSESRTPRQLEGIVFSGAQGMVSRSELAKAVRKLTNARVRRAYETASSGRVPQGIIEDLRLRGVDRVHHVSLDFDQLGAHAYLAAAGWIKEGGAPLPLPQPVASPFTVELARVDGEPVPVPLVGPLEGSDAAGTRWDYASDDALVHIHDACALTGSYWIVAGARTDEPLELTVTDTATGDSVSQVVWTDRRDVSRLSDTATLAACD